MKKVKHSKLALSTETLAPIAGVALDRVAGGARTGQTVIDEEFTAQCSLPQSFRCRTR